MTPTEIVVIALALGGLATAVGSAGWILGQLRPRDRARYATVEHMESVLARQQQRHDAAIAAMERRLEAAGARQDTLERELEDEREKRREDHARVAAMWRLLEQWMSYARQLGDIIRRELKTDPPPEPAVELPAAAARGGPKSGEQVRVKQLLVELFSASEMADLAFDLLGPEVEVEGETRSERAQWLVTAARQRKLWQELVRLCREKRPAGGF